MILSDASIEGYIKSGELVIEPLGDNAIQPASVDLRLGPEFAIMGRPRGGYIDAADRLDPDAIQHHDAQLHRSFMLLPGELVLASTMEYVEIPSFLSARIEGKSSLGRLGLLVHSTAGFVDPGFKGQLTLEMSTLLRVPVKVWPGMRIAQLSFTQMSSPAKRPYGSPGLGSHYQGQRGPTASRVGVKA